MLRGTCQYYLAYRANTSAREAALLRMLEADFADSYHGTRGKLKHKGGESRGRWVTGNGKVKGGMHKHLQFTRGHESHKGNSNRSRGGAKLSPRPPFVSFPQIE